VKQAMVAREMGFYIAMTSIVIMIMTKTAPRKNTGTRDQIRIGGDV